MKILKAFLPIIIMLSPVLSFAGVFVGIVVDEQGEAIPFSTLVLKRTDEHVHTNFAGVFELNDVVVGDSLFVRSLGFKNKTVVVENAEEELIIKMEKNIFNLDEVEVSSGIDALNVFTKIDLNTTPVASSQEVLRTVPGLIIGQHAGGGKAEQIFLRGFDIDHGTDINITVDGMPVNMVSHAHGQGYSDLHFLIPETIEKIDFGKGPYQADQGNFATAGYAAFQTKDKFNNNSLKMEYGSFNTFRTLGLFNVLTEENRSAFIATDYQLSDGPFESSQDFKRINFMGKYTNRYANDDKLSITFSKFTSRWDASGQIPERLVKSGTLGRFGAVDDTEGGSTQRTNLKFDFIKKINNASFVKNTAYYSTYDFELFSNFTFFLDDPINGDQIRQNEKRQIFGANSEWNKFFHHDHSLKVGFGFRNDQVEDLELSHTRNRRTTLNVIQLGEVDETNIYGYVTADLVFGKLTINPAIRYDAFNFKYNDLSDTIYNIQTVEEGIPSPKLNFLYNHSNSLQVYLKSGIGFHSNDTRVVVNRKDKKTLPAAYGGDIGTIWKVTPNLLINTALWTLFSEQEFVYVGDAGIVEPSGRTLRAGVDFGLRYQVTDYIFIYADVNYARPRAYDEPDSVNRVPLAPEFTATGGINLLNYKKFSGGMQFRYIADRPANEDNSIVAEGYFITDVNVSYAFKNVTFGVAINNLLDSEWKETQFATESRLSTESTPVEEIHFTPGAPFSIRGNITYNF